MNYKPSEIEIVFRDSKPPEIIFEMIFLKPVRYHKKKRLRKKWLKRYGTVRKVYAVHGHMEGEDFRIEKVEEI